MTVPGYEDICKPERPACNLSAIKLLACVLGVLRMMISCFFQPEQKRFRSAIPKPRFSECLQFRYCT